MTPEEKKYIEDHINTYRLYPPEYTGRRDKKILYRMNRDYKFNPKNQTITRREGRINDRGNFELIGLFRFPVGKPEEKVPADELDIEPIIKSYNHLITDFGYEDKTIAPGTDRENWNLRDMVSEVEYIRSTFYDKDHVNSKLRAEDEKDFYNRTSRLRRFIRVYKPLIDNLVTHTSHNSKYDN